LRDHGEGRRGDGPRDHRPRRLSVSRAGPNRHSRKYTPVGTLEAFGGPTGVSRQSAFTIRDHQRSTRGTTMSETEQAESVKAVPDRAVPERAASEPRQQVLNRLRRARGQLNAVIDMVE